MLKSCKQRQLFLFLGYLTLIVLATHLAFFIRFGYFFNVFRNYTGVTTITVSLHLVFLYIFNLGDPDSNMQWEDTAVRCMTAAALACYPAVLFFYYLPGRGHGQSLLFIQMVLTWIFTFIWQRLYLDYILSSNVQKKEKVLIVGAGRSGHFFYEWL